MHPETRRMTDEALPPLAAPAPTLGLAWLARLVTDGHRLTAVWDGLIERITADPGDAGALLDLSTLLQLTGNRDKGLELQATALDLQRCYRRTHGAGGGLRILAFMIAGDFMANTPLDFLLEGSDAELTLCYLDGALPAPAQLPEHDVAFLAIGQSEDSTRLLTGLEGAFQAWPRPVVNSRAELIAGMTRDGVADRFADHPLVFCPPTGRAARVALEAVAAGQALGAFFEGLEFPIIARPIGSHAGSGLAKLDDAAALGAYLAVHPQSEFYVAAFVDYAGADGLFRKLRIVFVMGQPFISHMAVSERWMVHYLNADMDQSAAKREEEAQMMATFDEGFALRHRAAFKALTEGFRLDYFGIDCAETADGRLLVFEADVAMIVHAMDPPDLYPYKPPAMAKLFAGFVAALQGAADAVRQAA
ncbi:MAG: glutathione synthase [Phenylobacterium sp.]|nr:glutathione synthase [Phenylobacterium sp.]